MGKVVTTFRDIGKVRHMLLTLPLSGVNEETNEVESITYKVRGCSPSESQMVLSIASLADAPEPPTKKRIRMPLDGQRLEASELSPGLQEEYLDYEDKTYKQELEIYTDELRLAEQRALMYRLMTCVQGFDMADEEIQECLGVPAHPREPIEEFVCRLDQLSEIILPEFDNHHYMELVKKITELSGVRTDRVNFT